MLGISILILAFGFAVSAVAQSSNCPAINVFGPAGVTVPGESSFYTVVIEPPDKAVGLSYLWSVQTTNGPVGMVRGQGTTQIEVPYTFASVNATVRVIGLPDGCPNSASETASAPLHPPLAIRLKTIVGPIDKVSRSVFEEIVKKWSEDPTARLLIIVSPSMRRSIKSKRNAIELKLERSSKEVIRNTDFVTSSKSDDKTTFWLVPAGAEGPPL